MKFLKRRSGAYKEVVFKIPRPPLIKGEKGEGGFEPVDFVADSPVQRAPTCLQVNDKWI